MTKPTTASAKVSRNAAKALALLADKYETTQSQILTSLVERWVLAYDPDVASAASIAPRKRNPFAPGVDEVPMSTVFVRSVQHADATPELPDDPNAPAVPPLRPGGWQRVNIPTPVEPTDDLPPSKRQRMLP